MFHEDGSIDGHEEAKSRISQLCERAQKRGEMRQNCCAVPNINVSHFLFLNELNMNLI